MPGKSTYLARAVLNHIFRGTAYTAPANVYMSLHNADPTDANNTATELTIGALGYARVAIAAGSGSWTAPSTSGADEIISNVNTISWGTPTGNWNSGNPITHVGMYDAATGGNLLYSGSIGTARTVLSTDTPPQFAPGTLVLREN